MVSRNGTVHVKLIPDLFIMAALLRQLTKNDSEWSWRPEHKAAFEKLKNSLMMEEPVLKYYNVSKQLPCLLIAVALDLELCCFRKISQ